MLRAEREASERERFKRYPLLRLRAARRANKLFKLPALGELLLRSLEEQS